MAKSGKRKALDLPKLPKGSFGRFGSSLDDDVSQDQDASEALLLARQLAVRGEWGKTDLDEIESAIATDPAGWLSCLRTLEVEAGQHIHAASKGCKSK